MPQALDGAQPSAGLTTLIATLVFVLPLLVWYRYSEQIASSGGLFAFVEAATGPPIARIQAGFWIFSYFLYLVYTVPFIAYDLVPVVFPQTTSYRLLIDVVLVVLVMAVMLSPLIVTLSVTAIIAGSQLVIAVLLAALSLIHLGVPADSFVGHGNLAAVLQGAGRTSSLYVCASLPLFLGGEVRGGGTAVRRGLVWAFASVGALAVTAVFPLAHANTSIINSNLPGVSLVQAFDGRALVVLVGIGVAASVAGLIIAEFIALSRLLGAVFKRPNRQMVLLISALFLVGSLISLLNPTDAYSLLLKPSLIALWISQVIVVAVYPWFVRHHRKVRVADAALAAAASVVMLIGLYTAFATTGT